LFLWLNILPNIQGLVLGTVVMFAGLFTIAFGTFFYIRSGFGAGPRDSLMVGLKRKTKLPVGLCRGLLEGSVVLAGWLLGGPVGIGTLLAAFGISACIQVVFLSLMKFEATSVQHETLDVTIKNLRELMGKGKIKEEAAEEKAPIK
jgi:uncharacterized membrane protein YczE